MTTSEILMVCLTAVIATAGVVGAVIFNNQLVVMQGQLDEMKSAGENTKRAADAAKESADAARDAVKLAGETAERQLRAYVSAGEATIQNFGFAEIIKGRVIVKNSGQTPAYKMKIKTTFGFDEYPLRTKPPAPDDLVEETDLGPGDFTQSLSPMARILTSEEIGRIRDGHAAIYFIGVIEYRDAFGHERITKFRRLFGGYAGVNDQGAMATDKEGNESD